jgi:hypothetical protein
VANVGHGERASRLIECEEGESYRGRIGVPQCPLNDHDPGVRSTFVIELSAQALEIPSIPRHDASAFRCGPGELIFIGPAFPADVVDADDIKAEPTTDARDVGREILVNYAPHRRASR